MLDKMSEGRKPKILICFVEAGPRINYRVTERGTDIVTERCVVVSY